MFEIHKLEANLCYIAMTHLCKPKKKKSQETPQSRCEFLWVHKLECYRGSQAGHPLTNEFIVVNNGSSSIL